MDMYRKVISNQNLGEGERITSKFLSTFDLFSLNPDHKTVRGGWSIAKIDNKSY